MNLRLPPILLLALLGGALGACSSGTDADEARLCRLVLPALNGGDRLELSEARRGPFPASLRIDYQAVSPDGTARMRLVICRYAPGRNAQGRRELTGLATEAGPMAEASFYFLRRFYLEGAEPPVDPDPPERRSGIPEAPYWLAYGAQQLLAALPVGAIYALLAAAYALVYGLVRRIVLVFGEFAALASLAGVAGLGVFFVSGAQTALTGVLIALAFGVSSAALHGFALSRLALAPLARAPGRHVLIASIGAGIALTEYLRLAQGADLRWLPPVMNEPTALLRAGSFVATITGVLALATLVGFSAVTGLILYMKRSAYGRRWQAVADDAGMAALLGVDEARVHDRAVVVACGLAGLAGLIVTVLYGGMGFAGGFTLGLKALIAAILGGVGSVPGAALGGVLLAAFEALWSSTMPIEGRDIMTYAALIVVLVFRPGGLFGFADGSPRTI